MKKPIPVKSKIIPVLRELRERENLEWVSVNLIVLMIYRREQIDPRHERFVRRNWTYKESERVVVMRAISSLEAEGKVERRKVLIRNRYPEHERVFGGIQSFTEVREVKEKATEEKEIESTVVKL